MELEDAYLRHILLHLHSGDPDASTLKTFLNSWFAHHAGGPFVDSGKARWLSRSFTKRATAKHVHAISYAARDALVRDAIDELVIDHVIPSAQLISGLQARDRRSPFSGPCELPPYLARRFTLALLTKSEHDLQLGPWKSKMTDGWCDEAFEIDDSTRYSRYAAGGIRFDIQVSHSCSLTRNLG